MDIKKKFLLLIILAFGTFIGKAQFFEPLDPSFLDKNNLVDSILAKNSASPMSLPVGKEKLNLLYYELLEAEELLHTYYGLYTEDEYLIDNPKTGKKTKAEIYQKPNLYYAILDLPKDQGRFYGAITCGYNPIEEVMELPHTSWHPYTEVKLIRGTIVRPDGSQEEFTIHDKKNTNLLSNPSGSYWAHDILGFQDVQFIFNPNGTGTITCYYHKINWTLMLLGGSFSTKYPNERHARNINRLTGGYEVWMQPIAKRSFKWEKELNNALIIRPYGSATPSLEEDIQRVKFSKNLNRKELDRQNAGDFKTNRESAISRQYLKKIIKKDVEAIDEIIIEPKFILSNEMFGKISADISFKEYIEYPEMEMEEWKWRLMGNDEASMKRISDGCHPKLAYFGKTKPRIYEAVVDIHVLSTIMDLPVIFFNKIGHVYNFVKEHRSMGANLVSNRMKKEIKRAIEKYPEVFENTKSYQVGDINPINKTATIFFTLPNKIYSVDVAYNDKGEIDLQILKDSKINLDLISKRLDQIEELNNQILSHKKDKDKNKRKKVKNYEKIYKEFLKTQNQNFTTVDEVWEICIDLNEFIKKQKEIKDSFSSGI